jgi:hypothetical protein
MATFESLAFDPSASPATPLDVASQLMQPMGIAQVESLAPPPPFSPAEPSSLALTLVGVATLAAYRAVVHRVIGPPAKAAPLIKPRRRAA